MSFMHLNSHPVDGCQRVSYRQTSAIGLLNKDEIDGRDDSATGDGVIICKKLVLGCKPEENDDYRPFIFEPTWCVYIKALDNVDMGGYVKRVTFRMSPRLPLRLHVADASPFEITEVLSTDFPIELQVEYLDASMSPTTYMYKPNDVFDGKYNVDDRMNFLGHERTDKMFFVNPSTDTQLTLTTSAPQPLLQPPSLTPTQARTIAEKRAKKQKPSRPSKQSANSQITRTAPRPIFNLCLP
ncbi:YEATS domain-containing protein 4 [Drosophila grimshawi]|uniref:GH24105 n=1 Tax=Drosophila grimshawi TaxID=7222 RepID=B4JNN9_DROGR|nr:YEATS domain-containing protein 4 [Drosophila grimshawi]EDV92332.1 GH24105 [Drosophila grimshawi]